MRWTTPVIGSFIHNVFQGDALPSVALDFAPLFVEHRFITCKVPPRCNDGLSSFSVLTSNLLEPFRTTTRVDSDSGGLQFLVEVDPLCAGLPQVSCTSEMVEGSRWRLPLEDCDDPSLLVASCWHNCSSPFAPHERGGGEGLASTQCLVEVDPLDRLGLRNRGIGTCRLMDEECIGTGQLSMRLVCTGFGSPSSRPEVPNLPADIKSRRVSPLVNCAISANFKELNTTVLHYSSEENRMVEGCPNAARLRGVIGAGCYAKRSRAMPCFELLPSSRWHEPRRSGQMVCEGVWSMWGECEYTPPDGCTRSRVFEPSDPLGPACRSVARSVRVGCDYCDSSHASNSEKPAKAADAPCLGHWKPWEAYDERCVRKRHYVVDVPPKGGGAPCHFENGSVLIEVGSASSVPRVGVVGVCPTAIVAQREALDLTARQNNPIDGCWWRWDTWSTACDAYCSIRNRAIAMPADTSRSCIGRGEMYGVVRCPHNECPDAEGPLRIVMEGLSPANVLGQLAVFESELIQLLANASNAKPRQFQFRNISANDGKLTASVAVLRRRVKKWQDEEEAEQYDVHPMDILTAIEDLRGQIFDLPTFSNGWVSVASVDIEKPVSLQPDDPLLRPASAQSSTITHRLLAAGGSLILLVAFLRYTRRALKRHRANWRSTSLLQRPIFSSTSMGAEPHVFGHSSATLSTPRQGPSSLSSHWSARRPSMHLYSAVEMQRRQQESDSCEAVYILKN